MRHSRVIAATAWKQGAAVKMLEFHAHVSGQIGFADQCGAVAGYVIDADAGLFSLTHGGRTIRCRESLSELTSGVAFSICDDKATTRRLLEDAGLRVPTQQRAGTKKENHEFFDTYGRVVVKPAHGEQGHGIAVDIRTKKALDAAVKQAAQSDGRGPARHRHRR